METQPAAAAARVYTFPDVQKASEARARIARYGLDAFLIPAQRAGSRGPVGMRMVVIIPQGVR